MAVNYINFRYRFVDEANKPTSTLAFNGRVDENEGLFLHETQVLFSDIHSTHLFEDRLSIVLYPYIALAADITDNILPQTTTFVLSIADEASKEVKSVLDQHISTLRAFYQKQKMAESGALSKFRATQCPNCDAIVDLSYLKETAFVYCKYCETLFDKHGQIARQTQDYKICPQCEYYNRVQTYPEFRFYLFPSSSEASYGKHYFCDTCAERMYEKTIRKNAWFLIGLPFNMYLKYKINDNRNQLLKELAEANRLAQDGKLDEANELYSILMLHNNEHPGLCMNYGLAFLKAQKYTKAAFQFQKALEYCANYEPVLQILEKYKSINWSV